MEGIKQEKFSKSIGYLLFSQILIKVLGLVYSLYLINKPYFGDEGNAIYLSGYQVFVFMLTFSCIGVPNAVSNYIAKSNSHLALNKIFKSAVIIYVFIGSISSILLFTFSNLIAKYVFGIECISYNLKLFAPVIIISTLEGIYIGYFNGIKQMKITAKIQLIEQVIKTFFTIFIVEVISNKTNNPEILSIGATLAVIISITISFCMCYFEKRNLRVCSKNIKDVDIRYKDIIIKLIKFSIPISIGAMLIGLNKNCDSFTIMNILANKIGKTEAQKIYGIIASKVDCLIALPMSFNMIFSTALIPNISEARKSNNKNAIKLLVENAIFMSMAIGMAFFAGMYLFSDEIFELLFSNSKDGADLLKIASVSVIFALLNQTFIGILQGFEKNNISVKAALLGTVVKMLLNIILINQEIFYKNAIIISSIVSNVLMCFMTFWEVKKNISFKFKYYFFINAFLVFIMIICIKFLYKTLLFFKVMQKLAFVFSVGIGGIIFLVEILIISRFLGFLKNI